MELIKQALKINGATTRLSAGRELEPDVAQKQREQMLEGLHSLLKELMNWENSESC
tara:strand:+ start:597 stop:764 length:168 start_codon:yes stop_codon:yes gene_type:complete